MQMGTNETTVLLSEIKASVDQISDVFSELRWEFKQGQEYNCIFHFQLKCWKVKERQNGRSTKVRHENFPNSRIYCIYYWNFMKAGYVSEGPREREQEEKVEFSVLSLVVSLEEPHPPSFLTSRRPGDGRGGGASGGDSISLPAGLSSLWTELSTPLGSCQQLQQGLWGVTRHIL